MTLMVLADYLGPAALARQTLSPKPPAGSPLPPQSLAGAAEPISSAPQAGCSGTAPALAAPGSAPSCATLALATDGRVPGVDPEPLGAQEFHDSKTS